MTWLDRLAGRLRPDTAEVDEDTGTRRAIARSEEIQRLVEDQEPEVRRHRAFARLAIRENELAPKIRRALRGSH